MSIKSKLLNMTNNTTEIKLSEDVKNEIERIRDLTDDETTLGDIKMLLLILLDILADENFLDS